MSIPPNDPYSQALLQLRAYKEQAATQASETADLEKRLGKVAATFQAQGREIEKMQTFVEKATSNGLRYIAGTQQSNPDFPDEVNAVVTTCAAVSDTVSLEKK